MNCYRFRNRVFYENTKLWRLIRAKNPVSLILMGILATKFIQSRHKAIPPNKPLTLGTIFTCGGKSKTIFLVLPPPM